MRQVEAILLREGPEVGTRVTQYHHLFGSFLLLFLSAVEGLSRRRLSATISLWYICTHSLVRAVKGVGSKEWGLGIRALTGRRTPPGARDWLPSVGSCLRKLLPDH